MQLSQHLNPELVLISPALSGRDELFDRFGEMFKTVGLVKRANTVVQLLHEREAILSTGIGGGVAIPHAQVNGLGRLAMAASVHPDGISYPALDDSPVRLVFCLIGDTSTTADHLTGLARLARIARKREALEALIAATSGERFSHILSELEAI